MDRDHSGAAPFSAPVTNRMSIRFTIHYYGQTAALDAQHEVISAGIEPMEMPPPRAVRLMATRTEVRSIHGPVKLGG